MWMISEQNVDKNGNKNWLISRATLSLPPPLKKGNKFFENKLKFKPKAIKEYSRKFWQETYEPLPLHSHFKKWEWR